MHERLNCSAVQLKTKYELPEGEVKHVGNVQFLVEGGKGRVRDKRFLKRKPTSCTMCKLFCLPQ